MNTEPDWFEQIEAYNLHRLSPAEAAAFEAAMQADTELAAAVQAHRVEWEAGELLAEKMLRSMIREEMAAHPFTNPPRNGWLKANWKWVGLLLLLLGGAIFLIFRQSDNEKPAVPEQPAQKAPLPQAATPGIPDTQTTPPTVQRPIAETKKAPELRQLALAAYQVPEGLSGIRGPNDDDKFTFATRAFMEKNYRLTLELLDPLPENDGQEALSLRAHSHFSTGSFSAAVRDFEALKAGGIYVREAEWYGLLARMAMPAADKMALRKELERIAGVVGHPYGEVAKGVLQKGF